MSRFHAAVACIVVALAVTSAAGPMDPSCILQKDTMVGRFKLSTLDGLFGELLTTETMGSVYFVSICRPISQPFYDARKLAGAVKMTSDGHLIDLGRIDQTNVIVNEDTIVLTYVGGDRDENPHDRCKGLRWKTYVVFVCDVSATKDVLTLFDEDPDQPDICQVWFEIKTTKTCVRNPHVPLDVLDKELSKHYKEVYGQKSLEKMKNSSYGSSIRNKLSNNETSELNIHQNNSQNSNSKNEPFVHLSPYPIIENNNFHREIFKEKVYDNGKNEISSDSSKYKPFTNINSNHINNSKIINNEKKENYLHKNNSYETSSEVKPFINEKKVDNYHQNHSESEPFNYKNSNHSIIAEKTINNEKKENDLHKNASEAKFYDKEKNEFSSDSFKYKPFTQIHSNHINKSKIINDEKEENDFHQNHSYKNNSKNEHLIYKNTNYTIANETSNNEKKENSNHNSPAEKLSNIKKNENRIKNKFPDEDHSQNTYSENISSRNKKEAVNKDFDHENYDIKNDTSNLNVPKINNGNEIHDAHEKHNNISHYKNKDYIINRHNTSENLPINSTNAAHKSSNYENRNENVHKNISEGTSHDKEKLSSVKNNDINEKNSSSQHTYDNHSSNNDTDDLSGNKSNVNHIPHNIPEEIHVRNVSEDYGKGKSVEHHVIKSNKVTHSYSEIKPPHVRDSNSSENKTSDEHKFEDWNKNNSTSINHKSIIDHENNAIANANVKHRNNSSSRTTFDDNKNKSGAVENESIKKHFVESHNYNRTNDRSEFNGTFIKPKYTENSSTADHSESGHRANPTDSSPSAQLPNNNDDNDSLKAANSPGLFEGMFLKLKNLFSNVLPNGIQLSPVTIFGGLASFTAIFGLVGTAINRFYYKRTGTDQIPFKGTFQCVYSYIKGFVSKLFCCCGRDDSEEPDGSNEKTPLLHPKNIATPTVEDETSRKNEKRGKSSDEDERRQRSKYSGEDDSGERNNEKQYGSLLDERLSPTSDKNYRKKKRKPKTSNSSSSDSGPESESWLFQDKGKRVELGSQEKSPSGEIMSTKQSATNVEQVVPSNVFEKMGPKFKKKEENVESVQNVTSLESQDAQSGIQSDVYETKAGDSEDESVEVIEEIVYVEDGEDEEEIIEEITETTTVEEVPDKSDDESGFEKSQSLQSLTDPGARKELTTVTVRKSVRKISSSSSPGEVKTIEETVVTDNSGKNAKKGFGIKLGIGKSGVNMSVGEKKLGIGKSGMKFGKLKEQEDEKEKEAMTIKLNKSGIKLHRNKNKSPINTAGEVVGELNKQSVVPPEKNKKSKSKSAFKLFKRSTSQPSISEPSISEPSVSNVLDFTQNPRPDDTVEEEEVPNISAGLLIFGKSRSRSSEIMKRTL